MHDTINNKQHSQMSARNNLISLVGFCSQILGFILFCKYLSLFFNRKTDIKPFLMSKNWMIFAIAVSAISIFVLVMDMLKDKKNLSKAERKVGILGTVSIVISAAVGLMAIIAFSLYLAGAISESSIVTVTKILVAVDLISFMILIALLCCCCCLCCGVIGAALTAQSAVKDDGSVLNTDSLNFAFTSENQNLDPELSSNGNQKLIVDGGTILEKVDQYQVKIDQENSKVSRSMSVDSSDQLNAELTLVA